MDSKYPVLCLMGPTAVGKSSVAMKMAEKIPVEIISVDSAMVYRDMDIGTAKPSKEDQERVKHHLIDICDPSEPYSVADFKKDVERLIPEIHERNRIPLLVGGTMMYFNALQKGLTNLPSADQFIRERITQEAEKYGWPALHEKLKKIDPKSVEKIHANDAQRIQRALEVYEITGSPLTDLFEGNEKMELPYFFVNLAIVPSDRKKLHQKIESRFDEMLQQGLIGEVEKLFKRGDLNVSLPAVRAVGYRQVWMYLSGELAREAMREKAIVATRQLAKRQLTWLRSWENIHCFQDNAPDVLLEILSLLRTI